MLDFDIVNDLDNISSNEIKVYPNPVSDNLIIEINQNLNLSSNLMIEIYDNLGRVIQTDIISIYGGSLKAEISLKGYSSGSYFVKCYDNTFEKYFRIVKI